jgi:hypothetical protein
MFLGNEMKKEDPSQMKEQPKETRPQEPAPPSSQADSNPPEKSTRRELIERYAMYAAVAAPLLLFASKAHAIHSQP